MKYTDEEIEMLARFIHDAAPPTTLTFEQLVGGKMDSMRRVVSNVLADGSADSLAPATSAAARLMREAREQGAAEMRERAANLLLDVCHDHPSTREIAASIRALAITRDC